MSCPFKVLLLIYRTMIKFKQCSKDGAAVYWLQSTDQQGRVNIYIYGQLCTTDTNTRSPRLVCDLVLKSPTDPFTDYSIKKQFRCGANSLSSWDKVQKRYISTFYSRILINLLISFTFDQVTGIIGCGQNVLNNVIYKPNIVVINFVIFKGTCSGSLTLPILYVCLFIFFRLLVSKIKGNCHWKARNFTDRFRCQYLGSEPWEVCFIEDGRINGLINVAR